MSHERINPETLFDSNPFGFTQVVKSRGDTLVHCSGQTSWNRDGVLVGDGDLHAQLDEALVNLGNALAAAGARPEDVASVRVYCVDHKQESLPVIGQAITRFFGRDHLPASTLLGVERLAVPGFLVEIEAQAVISSHAGA